MIHRTCHAQRCAHCGAAPPGFKVTPRPLTPADLCWYFGESEAAMGVRSTHGAFVDMAMSGIQSGGKANGVEARAVEERRLHAVGRARCIAARIAHVGPGDLAVLRALYGLDHWTAAPELGQVRAMLQAALGELADVAPMTATARDHAARRQAHRGPAGDVEPVYGSWEVVACDIATREDVVEERGLRCVYRPSAPTRPKPPKDRPSSPRRSTEKPQDAARRLLADDPALAANPRGAVIAAVAREDKTELRTLLREAGALVTAARAAAFVVDLQPSRRIRSTTHSAGARRPVEEPEYLERQHAEVLAGG